MSAQRARLHPALPLRHWPAADRSAWEGAHRQGEFLTASGHATTWRAASQRSAQGAYGRWLGWLTTQGIDLEAEAPAARVTEDRMRAYVAFLQEGRSPVTVASYLGVLCMTLIAMFPDHDWGWLRALQAALRRRARPVRSKWPRLVPANDLLQLGLDLLGQAGAVLDRAKAPERSRQMAAAARDYRDGLIIALLASRVPRLRNLLGIEIGTQLRQSNGSVSLHFKATETKNKRPQTMAWPEILLPALHRYLTQVRPMLIPTAAPRDPNRPLRPPGAALWVGQGGTPLTPGGLQKALRRHTTPRFGHTINAHLFRDCAATTVANLDPVHVRHAAGLLGHRSLRTTERSYISADSGPALRQHHDLILAMRKAARQHRHLWEQNER